MEEAVKEENNSSQKKKILSFSIKYWKNGRSQAKKFRKPGKNSGKVGRMEEAVEEENYSKLKNIFSFIFQKIL